MISGACYRSNLSGLSKLAYQRNDDDEEEAARERRRRARQERLRQREEDDVSGTEKPELNAQNNIGDEDSKSSTSAITTVRNTQGDGDGDEALFLERMARREERRQKRLQEAMERQKEFDPTVTDDSLSFTNRREVNNVEENEAPGKEDKVETHRGRYEIEETETITRSYQRNNLRQDEEDEKKEEADEEAQEEKPKQRNLEENQVEVTIEKKILDKEDEAVVLDLKLPEVNADDQKVANDANAVEEEQIESEEAVSITVALEGKKDEEDEAEKKRIEEKERLEKEEIEKAKAEEERRAEEEREKRAAEEKERLEQEERERQKAEEERKAEEEKRAAEEERRRLEEEKRAAEEERKRLEEEAKRAAEEKERLEAEERERLKAEERRKAEEERKRVEAEEKRAAEEKKRREAEEKKAAEERERAKEKERRAAEAKRAAEERAKLEEEKLKAKQKAEEKRVDDKQGKGKKGEEKKIEEKQVKEKKVQEEKTPAASLRKQIKDSKVNKDKAPKDEVKPWDRKKGIPESKPQNGERFPELPAHKLKHMDNTFSRPGLKTTPNAEDAKPATTVEAGKRVEELRRRRGENENEEFEKMKQKQQEAAVELEELKKKREERRKILEEEEQRRKKDEAERKAREEEEKRRLKEEIERRRAEAAEKRQKMPDEGLSEDKKPFKCFTPKGSSLKIEERAEFLNKSAQKSGVKPTHATAVVSKIDSRLEQYTSAIEGTKAARPVKAAPSDLPVPAEGVRNIKSMWEKGNVFSSPSVTGTPNKETAGLKVGVSSRINNWLTKTPENNKSPAPKPSDLRPGDVSGKRNLWEKQSVEKATSPTKVTAAGKKSETNAGLRQFEKEP